MVDLKIQKYNIQQTVTFTKLIDKDFQGSATAGKVTFDQTIQAKVFPFSS